MPLLVDRYGDALYGFCRKLERSKDGADELFQQTFLRAMEICEKIDMQRNPQSFLFGIAVKMWQNSRSKADRRGRLAPMVEYDESALISTAPSALDEAQNKMLTERLSNLTNELPEKLRIPMLMFYGCDVPLSDIAQALGLPQGTVKSRLHKARLLIRKGLEADGYESF